MALRTPETLLMQGRGAYKERRLKYARMLFRKALKESKAQVEPAFRAEAHIAIGKVERDLQHSDTAEVHYRKGAEILRGLDVPLKLAHTIRHVGDILLDQSKLDQAERCYREALEIYRRNPETPPLDLANTLRGFALLKGATGHGTEAMGLWQEAGTLYRQVGVDAGISESEIQIAQLSKEFEQLPKNAGD
jgi:tetratricopeptide (TPR) repeat protein